MRLFASLKGPCYSLPALTQRLDQCFVCRSQASLKRSRLPGFVLPSASIHQGWIEHEGFSQAQERAFSWGRFRQQRPYSTRGLSRSVSHLDNVTWWQCNGNNDAGMTLGGAASLVGVLFIYLGMLFTCFQCHFYSIKAKFDSMWLNSATFTLAFFITEPGLCYDSVCAVWMRSTQ